MITLPAVLLLHSALLKIQRNSIFVKDAKIVNFFLLLLLLLKDLQIILKTLRFVLFRKNIHQASLTFEKF